MEAHQSLKDMWAAAEERLWQWEAEEPVWVRVCAPGSPFDFGYAFFGNRPRLLARLPGNSEPIPIAEMALRYQELASEHLRWLLVGLMVADDDVRDRKAKTAARIRSWMEVLPQGRLQDGTANEAPTLRA